MPFYDSSLSFYGVLHKRTFSSHEPLAFLFFVTSSIAFFFYIFNALCCFWGEINLRVAVTHVLLPVVQERKQEIPVCR